MIANTKQVSTLRDLLQSGLPIDCYQKLYARHAYVIDSQLRWVTITTLAGVTRKFWVYQTKFVTCGLPTLSSVAVYPTLRRFVREFNLMFHPDKYRGPTIDGLSDLLSKINHDPSVEAINDLLNILAIPINAKSAPSRDERNMYNIRLCDNLSDMSRTCDQRTIGLSFFHLPLIKQLTTDEFNRHTLTTISYAEPMFKKLCSIIFKDFKPHHCPKLKWAARATIVPAVRTALSCILRLIRTVHRTMAVSDDWVQFVNLTLMEANNSALAVTTLVNLAGDETESESDSSDGSEPVTPSPAAAPKYTTLRPAKIVVPQPTPEVAPPATPTHKATLKRQITPRTPAGEPRGPARHTKRVTRSMAAPRRSKRLRR